VRTARLEAFSDGVFAIAITLLVLELAIEPTGSAWDRVLGAWPSYVAYVVSFLTIGAAWLVHNAITERLVRADLSLLRLNLLLLFAVSVLPFPTRLVAEGLDDLSGERVFVTMYGLTLLAIRILLHTVAVYARRERLYAEDTQVQPGSDIDDADPRLRPVLVGYGLAILVGLVLPWVAVGAYCLIAIWLVVPFGAIRRALFSRE
jgi:uncharacterized membrane protein